MEIIEYDACCLTSSSSQLTESSHFLYNTTDVWMLNMQTQNMHTEHLSHFDGSASTLCAAAKQLDNHSVDPQECASVGFGVILGACKHQQHGNNVINANSMYSWGQRLLSLRNSAH